MRAHEPAVLTRIAAPPRRELRLRARAAGTRRRRRSPPTRPRSCGTTPATARRRTTTSRACTSRSRPACNIQCHYCNRKYDCANESRPGVVSERLAPEEAIRKVLAVAARGAGALGGRHRRAGRRAREPGGDLRDARGDPARGAGPRRCASRRTASRSPTTWTGWSALGVRHVTVTVNMIDPEVGERIYPWIAPRRAGRSAGARRRGSSRSGSSRASRASPRAGSS